MIGSCEVGMPVFLALVKLGVGMGGETGRECIWRESGEIGQVGEGGGWKRVRDWEKVNTRIRLGKCMDWKGRVIRGGLEKKR